MNEGHQGDSVADSPSYKSAAASPRRLWLHSSSSAAIGQAVLSVLTAMAVTGCATSGKRASVTSSAIEAPPAPYMRVIRSNSGPVRLQIALREFRPASRSGPSIWLVAVSHIGESAYYAAVQQHLDAQALVLFEGVGERPARTPSELPGAPSSNSKALAKGDADSAPSSLQSTLAQSLGLAFQLEAIDYDHPNFRNSDLTIAQIQALLAENVTADPTLAPDTNGGADDQLTQLVGLMDGSSLLGALVHAGVKLIGSSPKLQALMKIAVIEMFGNLEGDISQSPALPPEMKKLIGVLIQGRNQVVVKDLRSELPKLRKRQAVAVFYGAGHMHDLETRVRGELNYRPATELWLTAMSVDLNKAGVSDAELRMIQAVVKWQLEALQPKRSRTAN
jgi:hypothetical protein